MPLFTRPKPTQALFEISTSEVLVTEHNYHVTASHGQALTLRCDVQSGLLTSFRSVILAYTLSHFEHCEIVLASCSPFFIYTFFV